MRVLFRFLLAVLLAANAAYVIFFESFCKASSDSFKVISKNGTGRIYGSILDPEENKVFVLLQESTLKKIRSTGVQNLSVDLYSPIDPTKLYTVSTDNLFIQKKLINKKYKKYLVISLFNLKTKLGIDISPAILPSGEYKLKISGEKLNIATDSIIYFTPSLILGKVEAKTSGLVNVYDFEGNIISDNPVATNPDNGTFFTEVRANKASKLSTRNYLKAQVTGANNSPNKVNTALVIVNAEKEYKKIIPLDNKPETNTAIINEPVKLNDTSTLTANIAIEGVKEGNYDLALEAANQIIEDLKLNQENNTDESNEVKNEEENPDTQFECNIEDIEQFVSHCSESVSDLVSIGLNFKEFVKNANCTSSEFKLIKDILPKLSAEANEFIGRGYCEINKAQDENKLCNMYEEVQQDFKSGKTKELLCPPSLCDEFANIQPPTCVLPSGFCSKENKEHSTCLKKPEQDLLCAQIGIGLKEQGCKNENSQSLNIVTDSEGNSYCVPSNSSFENVAEYCKKTKCHKDCDKRFVYEPNDLGKCDVCECHLQCEEKEGIPESPTSPETKPTTPPESSAYPSPEPELTATLTPLPITSPIPSSSPNPSPVASSSIKLDYLFIHSTTGNIFYSYYNPGNNCLHLLNSNNIKLNNDDSSFCANSLIYGQIYGYVAPSYLNAYFQEGIQVKLCLSNNYNTCSPLVLVTKTIPASVATTSATVSNTTTINQPASASTATTASSATPTPVSSATPMPVSSATPTPESTATPNPTTSSIILDYIRIHQVTGNIFYSITNPFTNVCLHLLDSNNTKLHSDNSLFCGNGWFGGYVAPSSLNSYFQEGIQVKLCKSNDYNTCSNLVTVTKY